MWALADINNCKDFIVQQLSTAVILSMCVINDDLTSLEPVTADSNGSLRIVARNGKNNSTLKQL